MFWKEHGDTIKGHLTSFYNEYEYQKQGNPDLNVYQYAEGYIKNEIAMESGMDEYFAGLEIIEKYNQRILKAVKSVKGKAFHRHLLALIKDSGFVNWYEWEIVSEPSGVKQREDGYGREIKYIWVDQWSVGTEGDSFDGYIWVQIKKKKYLKFRYSC